jgi:tyrosyl-tRNA synthetase
MGLELVMRKKLTLGLDLYAYLVNYKHSLDLVALRTQSYRFTIGAALDSLGVPSGRVRFVDGSSYELSLKFSLDNYRLCTMVDEQEVRNTGDEYRHATKLSVLLCPGLPALAEEYLDSDFQFGGEDQVSILSAVCANEFSLRGFMVMYVAGPV